MENYSLQPNEFVLCKGKVAFKEAGDTKPIKNYNVELCLTNLRVYFAIKTAKTFSKDEVDYESYDIDTIKVYNDKLQVFRKENEVEIYFLNNEKCIEFTDKKEAKTFEEQILKLTSGNSKFVRNFLKVKKAIKGTSEALNIDVASMAKTATTLGLKTVVTLATMTNAAKPVQYAGNVATLFLSNENIKSEPKLLNNNEKVEQLTQLKTLLDKEAITQEEYDEMKKQILNL